MTIDELLEYLDGRGIVCVDDDLVIDALSEVGLALFDEIPERR